MYILYMIHSEFYMSLYGSIPPNPIFSQDICVSFLKDYGLSMLAEAIDI